ncbi:hypothetical protein FG379_000086 [Cryptosporidium bovis]|uniref:uncharacterized protein n=1 Tax=Cryptosporidium bovis TaxID=310047 RepID=UPI00351A301D|nr:hypothetical protein FG379_000086 [Cryptosporidium bovis]
MENAKDVDTSVQTIQKLQLLQNALESQKMIANLTSRCFKKCVAPPSLFPWRNKGKLNKKEKRCLWNCAQNYLQCYEFIGEKSKIIQDNEEKLMLE